MADQLYLSYKLHNPAAPNIVRAFEKLLRTFPYSRLTRSPSSLRVTAVRNTEPALYEESFEAPPDIEAVLKAHREYAGADTSSEFETWWDLWQYDKEWKLSPARVSLISYGPEFEFDREDDIRIAFGIDALFLPQPDLPNYLYMARSNIRSLLHLVHELDRVFEADSRRLWTESGENFAERLQKTLEEEEESPSTLQ